METSPTGVLGERAARPVGLVLRLDFGTAPIHHPATMAQTARGLGTKHSHVTQDLVQVKGLLFDKYDNVEKGAKRLIPKKTTIVHFFLLVCKL